MPLRLDIRRKLSARSDRVKSVDLHPTEPWMMCSLYNGNVQIWNFETQNIAKSFEVADVPVRCAKFAARKSWVITGSDDMLIRVFNYNTLEKVQTLEAHSDYIRFIAVHPQQPYFLSCSDDMSIKLWDWDKWQCVQTFEGHSHYVMMVTFNPKDANTFASASLDKTIKVWQLGSSVPNFTLEGHEKGVNCVDYYQGGEKPYLISGADDRSVKVWDYQNKTCVQTLTGHTHNVSVAAFHPELPIIITGSEDGTVRLWHVNTYRLENTLNYGMERVWALSYTRGSNNVALGYDEGSILIKLGREEPAMSMDGSGKIIWARHNEIQQANIKTVGDSSAVVDGEVLALATKELGSCEVYPQTLAHNPNGRFVVVCGDGEYIIYTALAWRNKSFGSAQEFVWAEDAGVYAVREGSSKIKVYKNFKEKGVVKPDFSAEGIYGGTLLGVRSSNSLAFYDWETSDLVRRIEIVPKAIYWSETGELCAICTEESYFVLRYSVANVNRFRESGAAVPDEGIEEAFDVLGEVQDSISTACWVGDCFLYTNASNRLNYYVGGEVVTVAHLDKPMYLLGYLPKENRAYLADKDFNVVSYAISVIVLQYQTCVMRRDFTAADQLMASIPTDQRTRVARFLEKQGFQEQALQVSTDLDHKFELALALKKLDVAYAIAKESDSEQKWKQLSELALACWNFALAEECMIQAKDYSGLLLLFSTAGNPQGLAKLADVTREFGKNNIAFVCLFLLRRLEECLDLLVETQRLPEATFFAQTYLPSQVPRVLHLWKADLRAKGHVKAAEALADPAEYINLFPDMELALKAEQMFKAERQRARPAAAYLQCKGELERNLIEEVQTGGYEPGLVDELKDVHHAAPPAIHTPPQHHQPAAAADEDEEDLEDALDDDMGFGAPVQPSIPAMKPASPIRARTPSPAPVLSPTPAAPSPVPAAAPVPRMMTPPSKDPEEDLLGFDDDDFGEGEDQITEDIDDDDEDLIGF